MSPFYKLWKEEVHVHLLAKVFQFTNLLLIFKVPTIICLRKNIKTFKHLK